MRLPSLTAILARLWLGMAGALGSGFVAYGTAVFRVEEPAFQCVTIGGLAAGIFTLVRIARGFEALALAVGFGFFQLYIVESSGWNGALSGWVLALGVFVVALIFELLARRGLRLGKFLVAGPLVGGVFLVVAPIAEFYTMTSANAMNTVFQYAFLGIVIGYGVGLGVEIADLFAWIKNRARANLGRAAADPNPAITESQR